VGFFSGCWGAGLSTHPPTRRTNVSLFVWVLPFDLSGKGGPTSSFATAGIALWNIAPRKPSYPVKYDFVKVESTRKSEEKLDGRYKEGHERKKPK